MTQQRRRMVAKGRTHRDSNDGRLGYDDYDYQTPVDVSQGSRRNKSKQDEVRGRDHSPDIGSYGVRSGSRVGGTAWRSRDVEASREYMTDYVHESRRPIVQGSGESRDEARESAEQNSSKRRKSDTAKRQGSSQKSANDLIATKPASADRLSKERLSLLDSPQSKGRVSSQQQDDRMTGIIESADTAVNTDPGDPYFGWKHAESLGFTKNYVQDANGFLESLTPLVESQAEMSNVLGKAQADGEVVEIQNPERPGGSVDPATIQSSVTTKKNVAMGDVGTKLPGHRGPNRPTAVDMWYGPEIHDFRAVQCDPRGWTVTYDNTDGSGRQR